MKTLHLVVTKNCELCEKGHETIKSLGLFLNVEKIEVEDGYQEYLLRVPVLLDGDKILDEGILSKTTILKNLLFS